MKDINVLFVDDEDNVLKSIVRLFANEPYGVAVAANTTEAMAILKREKIKVVLSDQRMPDMPGVEFLHRVKAHYPEVVRILFTAYADFTAIEQAINISEVFRFIDKPWHPEELRAAVVGALYHYDLVMENRILFETTQAKNKELQLANGKLKVLYDIQKEFSSTISHELRTPLTSIKAAIDIVSSGSAGEISDKQKDFLGRAKDNVDRLSRLINGILDLAHLESGKTALKIESGDLNKTVGSVAVSQEALVRSKGLQLTISLDENVPAAAFDRDKVAQVLNNLMANAVKFTDTGSISVSSVYRPEHNQVEISVKDTGPGIPSEDIVKLFEKFQQLGDPASRKYGGTGLGLAICKEIVRQHHGRIAVESKPGQGSRFYFVLPVDQRRDE